MVATINTTTAITQKRQGGDTKTYSPALILMQSAHQPDCRRIHTSEPCPLRIERLATSSIHHSGKRMPRRIRQSGNALRKLIRSLAAPGVVSGWEAKGQVQFPRTPP